MKFKEKPKMGKPKAKAPGVLNPKQAARLMKEKYLQQLDQRPEGPENETGYATGQVEEAGRWAVDELTVAADARAGRPRRARMKEKPAAGTEQPFQGAEGLPAGENRRNGQRTQGGERPGNDPKERGGPSSQRQQRTVTTGGRAEAPVLKERGVDRRTHPEPGRAPAEGPGTAPDSGRSADPRQAQRRPALNNRRRGAPAASHPPATGTGPRSAQGAPLAGGGRRAGGGLKERAPTRTLKARDTARRVAKAGRVTPKPRPPAVRPAAKLTARKARQQAQRQLARRMTAQTVKAAKTAAVAVKRVTVAVVKAAAALVSAVAGIVGGGVLLVALVVIIIIAAVANSPFGLFFAEERNAPDTVSVAEAVAQVNISYNARLEELQSGNYDGIVIHGQAPDWPDVLAVFAVKLAGADAGGMDVATLDADRVEKLTAVFWDMAAITTYVEEIPHEDWTEYILHITITPKTADDMRTAYTPSPPIKTPPWTSCWPTGRRCPPWPGALP